MIAVYGGVIICLVLFYLALRRPKQVPPYFKEEMGRLMVEFNRVADANIKIMEDKTEELKKVVELADDRIHRINILCANLDAFKEEGKVAKGESRYNRVFSLIHAGCKVADIAKEEGMSQSEVQMLIGLADKKKRVIGDRVIGYQ
ncbi:MAG: hypothetical protein QME81_02165 [bacterium]|nr:hypothetical protein [bacterium]